MAFIVKRDAVVIPAGIPVASTNTINVVDNFNINQTISLTKNTSIEYQTQSSPLPLVLGQEYCDYDSAFINVNLFKASLSLINGTWYYMYSTSTNCDGEYLNGIFKLSVAQVTNGIIPTTGWLQNGSPYSFIITAA